MADGSGGGNQPPPTDRVRNSLALSVSLSSIAVVVVLGVMIIGWAAPEGREQAVQLVLTAVLPLIGSWVGTILAYFFSSESLRTATQSVTTLTQHLTAQERLQSIPARDKMIRRADMKAVDTRPLNEILVGDAMKSLDAANVNRLIVLDTNDMPKLIIHRSFLDRYLASQSLKQPPPADLNVLTIQDMLGEPAFQTLLGSTFQTIREEATLAEAKVMMDQTSNCQDVFLTAKGSRNEPVLGWITNVIIEENSKV